MKSMVALSRRKKIKLENVTAWASEGEFYTGGFVLRNFIEPVTFAHCAVMSLFLTI